MLRPTYMFRRLSYVGGSDEEEAKRQKLLKTLDIIQKRR